MKRVIVTVMRMLFVLIKKDISVFMLRKNFFFFVLILSFSSIMALTSGFLDYSKRMNSYQAWKGIQSNSLSLLTYSPSLKGPGYSQSFKPSPLSILIYGAEDLITASFETRDWTKQFYGNLQNNTFLNGLIPRMDFATIFITLLPILLIFVLNDFIREEFAGKTYLNCRMFGVNTTLFLFSKLIVAFAATFLVSAGIILGGFGIVSGQGGQIDAIAERAIWFLSVIGLYNLFWCSAILLFQTGIRHSLKSATVGVAFWILTVFLLPTFLINSSQREGKGVVANYYSEKYKVFHDMMAKYKHSERIKTIRDIDPAEAYGKFSGEVEQAVGTCKTCFMKENNLYKNANQTSMDKLMQALSPSYLAVVSLSDISGTGMLDFFNFRQSMFNYFQTYISVIYHPVVVEWHQEMKSAPPIEQLSKLEVDFSRLSFANASENIKVYFWSIAIQAVVLTLVFLVIGTIIGRRESTQRW
jgi:ABC-type transport system involved in multi-copper enzyme maturation permease subunit